NFVLAGRTSLQHVTMPADYGKSSPIELPYGVFFNCKGLKDVTFPDEGGSCGYVTYGTLTEGGEVLHTIFDTIGTEDFCVYGPESTISGDIAYPRKSTWGLKSGRGKDIPYIYIDREGKKQVELSNGQYILIIDDNGVLKSCQYATTQQAVDAQTNGLDLVIPEYVGDKKVTGVDSNCFSDKTIHPYIKTLKIADNTLSEIAPEAFKDCAMLESVEIGNSVKKIGNSAFENCPKLKYVKFNPPADGNYASFPVENIGDKAFSTNAPTLIFEGDIDESYGPYVLATDVNNYVDPKNGTRVCYKTGYPTYLTVIVDNRNGYPTLVDYLHYDQIDKYAQEQGIITDTVHPSVIERYEKKGQEEADASGNATYTYKINAAEEKLVIAALNLEVPSGVKSIDVKGFINNTSPSTAGNELASNSYNVSAYLNTSPYYLQYKDADKGGLFRNYYGTVTGTDGKREYPTGDTLELEDIGNDRLRSVTLNSVKYLPDYVFYSCENLSSINLGSELTEMGDAPFTGCKNLTGIGSTTDNFVCENGIVYSKNDDGTYNIVEVLSARGSLIEGSMVIPSDADPKLYNVKEILPGAFENCDAVKGVDFTGNKIITEIPDNCFKDCDILSQVVLPENVKSIGHNAFAGCMEGIDVVCYGKEVYLPSDAFGTPTDTDDYKYVTRKNVISYEDSAVRKAAADLGADVSRVLDDSFKVRFFDYDGTQIGKTVFVKDGQSISMDDVPDDPVREGYEFTGWYPPLKGLKITEDSFIIARYELKPTKPDDKSGNNQDKDKSGNNQGGNGGSSSDKSGNNTATKFYTLTVTNGNGSGSYAAGATVIITCTNPPSGQVFDKWVPTTDDLGIASVNVAATTLKMPAHEASVTATFKKAPSNSSGSGGSGSKSGNNQGSKNSGTTVFITKPGVSNTSLASAQVSGSSDNYVIRISETAQATAAVEKALTNEYGSLDNVRYSAMDISLYDASGVNRITNYSGLSITITMPIPDVMTQYAGNNKVAGVVNEKLDKLKPKFTSIDGVPCVTFTATHFSPYTIYVNTSNLSGEPVTIDGSPKTGDGIHPKWFLVAGLVAISIALFFMKDKKPVPKSSLA
ncbi:MAG: leucine-rich repeat protein, partial [Lachnospiraceae bacterium]|nr:leucine-rich repeat protein [Lachnospiraceae bacterium]